MIRNQGERPVIGWREWVGLPALGVARIKAKVDTGARTSALHAFDIKAVRRGERSWVRFSVHPLQRNDRKIIACRALLVDRRYVVNSGGGRERRYVIETPMRMGDEEWLIELTLTNRDEMGFRMLLGRTAMQGHRIVDPARSYQAGRKSRRKSKARSGPRHDRPSDEEE